MIRRVANPISSIVSACFILIYHRACLIITGQASSPLLIQLYTRHESRLEVLLEIAVWRVTISR
jgi:hypothetical protein